MYFMFLSFLGPRSAWKMIGDNNQCLLVFTWKEVLAGLLSVPLGACLYLIIALLRAKCLPTWSLMPTYLSESLVFLFLGRTPNPFKKPNFGSKKGSQNPTTLELEETKIVTISTICWICFFQMGFDKHNYFEFCLMSSLHLLNLSCDIYSLPY